MNPPPPPYNRPAPAYIVALLSSMRAAHERAVSHAQEFEAAKAKILRRVHRDASAKQLTPSDLTVTERIAMKDQPTLSDARSAYDFWKGECDRLSLVIAAEEAAFNMITRYGGAGEVTRVES